MTHGGYLACFGCLAEFRAFQGAVLTERERDPGPGLRTPRPDAGVCQHTKPPAVMAGGFLRSGWKTCVSGDVVPGNGQTVHGSSIDLGGQYEYIAIQDVTHLQAGDFVFA